MGRAVVTLYAPDPDPERAKDGYEVSAEVEADTEAILAGDLSCASALAGCTRIVIPLSETQFMDVEVP